jgi:hypothetical protein
MTSFHNYVVIPQENMGMQIVTDERQEFELITYSYYGLGSSDEYCRPLKLTTHYSFITDFWGESFYNLCTILDKRGDFERVLFLNGDIQIAVSTINKMFKRAAENKYDFFQASLTSDSYGSHDFLVENDESLVDRKVPFIEIMMPGLSAKVVEEIVRMKIYTISGWGIDAVLFREIEKKIGSNGQFCIRDCKAKHIKPVESNLMKFKNGKTAIEELNALLKAFGYEEVK